jgi:4-alpha-glucanotransferase
VNYPREELFACLALAAAQRGAMVVGENLGTVPVDVNEALARHRILGTYVLQFAWDDLPTGRFRPPGPDEIATFGSHDMATFGAVWSGADLTGRRALGLLDDEGLTAERERRAALRPVIAAWLGLDAVAETGAGAGPGDGGGGPAGGVGGGPAGGGGGGGEHARAVLRGVHRVLAESASPLVVVNVEDCWLEQRPQNVPGTTDERWPNWRLTAAHPLETWDDQPGVRDAVEVLAALRPRPAPAPGSTT